VPPSGGKHVNSIVAGINLAVFAKTEHKDAALQFLKFMTSVPTQTALNKSYGSLPSVTDGYTDPAFQSADDKVLQNVLATSAAAMPPIPQESQFETAMGALMKGLVADAASGKAVTGKVIGDALNQAQQKMQAGG